MFKNILKIIIVFIIGVIGGIFADQILWPYFIERPLFYEYRLEQAPMHVTEQKNITVLENTALQDAVEIVEKSVVGIRTVTSKGRIITGSGLVVTSDGLIITLAELVPQGQKFAFFVDSKAPNYQILKRDLKNNLALIKLEDNNLSTIGFAEFGSLRFGQRVFLVEAVLKKGDLNKVVDEGIIKTYDQDLIETNISKNSNISGSPLFNIKGELVGLNIVEENKVSAVPVNKIREFVGF
jgi:serine protease Do